MLPLWILLLCFYCGGVCSAPHAAQSLDLQVEYGQSAVLPCDGSAYLEEDGSVQWEATGEDVAALQGAELRVGDRFTGRVRLAPEEKRREGDWSVVFEHTMLRDTDMYECIWEGRRTLSTVWLTVTPPQVERFVVASEGDDVMLRCFVEVSRNQSPQDLLVWWERNDTMLIHKRNESAVISDIDLDVYPVIPDDFNKHMDTIETFHVHMRPKSVHDSGEYSCWYKTRDSDDPRPGIPESITVTVLETNHTDTVFGRYETTTEDWDTSSYETTTSWTEGVTETPESTTDLTPVLLDDATQPMEVVTQPRPMEAFDETVTTFPDEDSSEMSSESLPWDAFPWVRTGLIAGVLLATAVVLCILGALRKL